MKKFLLAIAASAGVMIAEAMKAKTGDEGDAIVDEITRRALNIVETVTEKAEDVEDLTAEDVHAAVVAAATEVDALVAEATASLLSRQQ